MILTPTHIGGHVRVPATLCPNHGAFECFRSPGFNFAVPRVFHYQKEWTFDELRYELKGEESLVLLGREMRVVWIDQYGKDSQMRFVFSGAAGLIGFESVVPKGPIYLLQGQCGFASAKSCIEGSH